MVGLNVKLNLNYWSLKKKKRHELYSDNVIFELKMKS